MSTTGRSVLSGYWMVMGSRKRCENVTAMPSRMVLAAFDTLAMYSAKFIRECSSVDVHRYPPPPRKSSRFRGLAFYRGVRLPARQGPLAFGRARHAERLA